MKTRVKSFSVPEDTLAALRERFIAWEGISESSIVSIAIKELIELSDQEIVGKIAAAQKAELMKKVPV